MNRDSTDLMAVSGIGPNKLDSLQRAGFKTIGDLMAASQEELTKADRVGNALAARIKADVGFIGESTQIGLGENDIAVDRENKVWLITVSEPHSQADEVEIHPGTTVADWHNNEDYPDDDPVIDAVFLKDLYQVPKSNHQIQAYTYPVSRVLKADVDINEAKVEANIEEIEGLGPCQYCGSAITTEMESFIEGADGRRFCDITCYNAELNQ